MMDSPRILRSRPPWLLFVALLVSTLGATTAVAQTADQPQADGAAAGKANSAKGNRQAAKDKQPDAKAAGAGARKQANARKAPSPESQESIRRTVERRRERRARRAQGTGESLQPGAIVPWPMPPALIIRQTRETHDEIDSFLGLLRR